MPRKEIPTSPNRVMSVPGTSREYETEALLNIDAAARQLLQDTDPGGERGEFHVGAANVFALLRLGACLDRLSTILVEKQ